jgi:dTMP kinase
MKHDLPGRLIAVEGLDGSGKSTQLQLVHRWLEGQGRRVSFTEWNSSDLVKGATSKGKRRQLLSPTTFSLIHATDFADRYERQILPMLKAGFIVLCDRYVYTAYARDGVRGVDGGWLRRIYGYAVQPDLTFYFRLPLATALGRILHGRRRLKWFEAGMDLELSPDLRESFRIFQARIMAQYDEMVREFGFTVIDAAASAREQQAQVRRAIQGAIDLAQHESRVEWPARSGTDSRRQASIRPS